MQRHAVISGIGLVTPLGIGRQVFWTSLMAGLSGIRPITRFPAESYPMKVAGEVPDFDPKHYMDARETRRFPLVSQYAVAAAKMALEDADIQPGANNAIGACFATCISGGSDIIDDNVPAFLEKGYSTVAPWLSTNYSPHVVTANVAQILNLNGPKTTISSGCGSSMDVLEWARNRVESGAADIVVAGASDTPLFPFVFSMLCASRGYSPSTVCPRPFDHRHDGGAVSEGAGALIIEDKAHAINRGATIYAEILGYGSAGEPGDIYRAPDGSASERSMRFALADAELRPSDIDCVLPLAPGSPPIDRADCDTIRAVLGDHAYRIPVPGIEGALGHLVAASGLMQLSALALAIHHQQAPPTINFEKAAAGCDLDCVPNRGRHSRIRRAVALSRSLSRTCVSVALGQGRGTSPRPG